MLERTFMSSTSGPFQELVSAFAPCPVEIDEEPWPSIGHWFQAQKFTHPEIIDEIRRAPTAAAARKLGHSRDFPLRDDWEAAKVGVMLRGIRHKLQDHPRLGEQLLETGLSSIVKKDEGDRFWGDGGDGTGRNVMGGLLARVRRELRRHQDGVATAMSWKLRPRPTESAQLKFEARPFGWSEFDRLLRGNIPEEMEDKWFVYVDGHDVFFHRSWTGHMIFWAVLERGDLEHRINYVWASRDRSVYNWTGAADDLETIDGILRSRFGLEGAVAFDGRR